MFVLLSALMVWALRVERLSIADVLVYCVGPNLPFPGGPGFGNFRGTCLYCAFCPDGACVCVRVRMVSRWASAHCVCFPGVLCLSDVLVIENGLW